MKAIVLGCGLVGGRIAKNLAKDKDFKVTVADRDKKRLDELAGETNIKGVVADLSKLLISNIYSNRGEKA